MWPLILRGTHSNGRHRVECMMNGGRITGITRDGAAPEPGSMAKQSIAGAITV